ncbi:MAG: polysaccharide biosynthesis/export family protein [Planctomycetaceae bacterium]|jgi:polysaccharide export outer membrane protein|nr:polysaccharide biosynthesis/export family protein [Planctomycetaceae bacterium]
MSILTQNIDIKIGYSEKKLPGVFFFRVFFQFFLISIIVGCVSQTAFFDPKPAGTPSFRDIPKETAKSSLPQYFLESPDLITVEAIHLVPKSPYMLRVFDVIALDVIGTPVEEPIIGNFSVEPGGTIQLGGAYGAVRVEGLSLAEAEQAVSRHLIWSPENTQGRLGSNTVVSAKLVRMSDIQQIANTHLIGPDGYITLGSYGRVYINGLTVDECREAIEFHLSKALEHPQVAVDVYSYNSKEYYVIFQSAAMGEQVFAFPYTGNETVLKAIANTSGLAPNSSKRIWVARPVGNTHKPVILPVDWVAVTAYGMPQTNYQLLPGDRVFVVESRWVAADGMLARIIAPFERIMGFSLLGATTATRFYGRVMVGGGERAGYGSGGYNY